LKQRLGDAKVDAILHSFSYAADQTKARLENTFEKLFKYSAADFIEAFTEIFFVENPAALEFELMTINDLTAFEILAITPTCSPQHVLSNLLDSIRQRTPGAYHSRRRKIQRHGKLYVYFMLRYFCLTMEPILIMLLICLLFISLLITPNNSLFSFLLQKKKPTNRTDTSLLRFAEIYCIQMNRPESIQLLWPIIHAFAKDYLSQANTYKMFLPSLMRFLTVSLEVLSKSDAFDDRRTRKDAQELYQRCVDYCILIAGRSFDQSLWMRRANNTVYDDDDMSSINTDHTFSESGNVSTGNISDLEKKTSWKSNEDVMITQVNQYLAQEVIPRLRQLLVDNDKINSLLNNLVYYVIGPALKSKTA
jgi:hypothetical protein